jgi:hypothetical protein
VSQVVSVVAQRRRNRQFVALQVAPKSARPQALRDLYRVPGFKHEAAREGDFEHTPEPATTQTSTSSR